MEGGDSRKIWSCVEGMKLTNYRMDVIYFSFFLKEYHEDGKRFNDLFTC